MRRYRKIGLGVALLLLVVFGLQLPSRIMNVKARSLLSEYKLDRAERCLRISARLGPRLPETHLLFARTFRKQGEGEEMLKALDRFQSRGGRPEVADKEKLLYSVYGGDISGNLKAMDRLLIDQSGDEREILEAYVNGLMSNVRFEEAYTIIDEWKVAFPDDPLPHYARGRAAEHLRDDELAKQEYLTAIEKQPDHYRSLFALGRLHGSVNQFDAAKQYYSRCLEMAFDAAPRIGLAGCLLELGEPEAAKEETLKVTSQSPESLKKSYQRVGERLVGRPDAELLGKIEAALDNTPGALEWFNLAYQADPAKLDLRYARAMALRAAGKTEEARRELTAVSEAREKFREVDLIIDHLDMMAPEIESRLRIAEIFMEYGSAETAEYWLRSILAFNPNHPRAIELLSSYYAKLARQDPRYAATAEEFRQRAQASTR